MKKLTFLFLCLLIGIGLATAQTREITGSVISAEDDQPVIGASVIVKGTTTGTVTDYDGKFSLSVPSAAKTLVISYIGMAAQEVAIAPNVRVLLKADTQNLDEVVVTALGISREKKALGYAVSEVKGDEMLKARGGVSNPINALQGKVAGLQIQGGAGSMGGSSKVIIRGVKSISGNNQPLFVIDGVPVEGSDFNSTDAARGAGGYDYGNLIQDLNPDDIENISVLKGPNASALYGSRATNGVVMITTKKGKKGEGYGVTFNSSLGFEVVNKMPKMQKLYGGGYGFETVKINGKEYQYPDMATDESWGDKYEGQEILSWYDLAKWEAGGKVGNPTTSKWQTPANDIDSFFETGVVFTNNVSVAQATDRASARISYTNSDLKGFMPNSSLKKNIFNVSASTTSADKRLELFTNVTYFNSAAKGRSETGYGDNNVMQKFIQWGHRELDMKELKSLYQMPDGTQATWNRVAWDDATPNYSNNPYWSRYMNYQNDSRNRVYGNVGISYKIAEFLKFQYKANLDFFVDKQFERNAVYSQEQSRYKEMSRQQAEMNHEFLLSFNKNITDYSFSANLGSNLMSRRYEYVYGETDGGLAIPEFYNLKNSVNPATGTNYLRKKSINSIFASGTVGYKSMLYLDLSLRNDWSSTLPNGNNSYLYPSVTGSFIFSELVKEDLPWLNFGKVRLGFAQVGNDTDPYQIVDTYTQYTNITSTPGYVLANTLKNSGLKPETTNSYEAGLELSLFNNRFGIEATYYSSETKNQIIPLSITGTSGYLYKVVNTGLMTNQGIELSIHGTPVQTADFTWESSLVLASNKNKVKKLLEDVSYYRLTTAPFKVEVGAMEGQEYGVIMGTDFVYDAKGNRVINEDGSYAATDGNVNIGSIYPDFTGGWTNTFRFKNFDLSVLLDFSKGGNYFSTSYMWGMYSGMLEESAAINENGVNIRESIANGGGVLLQGVQADGTPNTVRMGAEDFGAQHYSGPAAQNVFKSDYVKLREINLGYTIPMKSNYFVKSLRVSAYGRNLAVWGPDVKHFDPEMAITNSGNIQGIEGGALPSVANFGMNVSVKF
ncbi:MAG: SusC/RagA family TonB-linked outer membrane protein [Bacteroidota bacterium]|jgi:TonB-linked SusC/RagA family outer membrane protein|nr:SusC/RagA family TonB-linked outer membrane protein [Parabacteroides chartae]MDT3369652.1 SusC/RagA family TonB-linked outer membrane protein [Bacteroidota bacterium]HML71679.1 SusC/RagA family TonB-linked outer membrane protein [Macellibacteroides fermentans]